MTYSRKCKGEVKRRKVMESLTYGRKFSLVLLAQTALYLLGICIFTRGFLLNRLVVPKNSTCNDSIAKSTPLYLRTGHNIDSCWRQARFKKAVLVVIDALRYDFMFYNGSLETKNALSFQNKLGVIHEVLKTKPGHGRIFQFVADPPTTTMQRIKGLTTGSLPTFVDAGSNFASAEIHEDNIIAQLKSRGKKVVFMGDDTWMGLFPDFFERYHPYPSFNVKDLHTVDNGVISHLIPEIERSDWDVIIAHFLGVDHCGHRYGPYHPAMAEKLTQMDDVLRSLVGALDNDTIMMVFGDHGMTKSGDHGGDSEDEIHAGLFVYSPKQLFFRPQEATEQVVAQTDIVPTLSLLLGLPIPFSNLGMIIPSLFEEAILQNVLKNMSKLHAFQLNARQVNRYITEYTQLSNDISLNALNDITKPLFKRNGSFSNNNTHFSNRTLGRDEILQEEDAYLTYLKKIRELCRTVWAKFDVPVIETGIFNVAVSCVISLACIIFSECFLQQIQSQKVYQYGMMAALIIFIPSCLLLHGYFLVLFMVFLLCGIAGLWTYHINIFGYVKQNFGEINFKGVIIMLVLCIQIAGFFSNSYVVNEDKILLFFLQTIILLSAGNILTNSVVGIKLENSKVYIRTQKQKDKKKRGLLLSAFEEKRHELVYLFLIMVLSRTGSLFWRCREEQSSCDSTELFSSEQNGYQLLLGSMFFILVPVSLVIHLRKSGNLSGYSSPVLAVKYALPFGAVFASLHWLLQRVPAKLVDHNPAIGFIQQILSPCILYCCCLGTLCCVLYQPITTFVLRPRDLEDEPAISTDQQSMRNSVVKIFKQLRSELSNAENSKDIPHVYGLGSVYSSAVLILLVCFGLPVALVLGDGMGPSVTSMMLQIYLFLEFDKILTSHEAVDTRIPLGSLLFPIITWSMMSSMNFYSSGHQATIPSIRFDAAFVGLPGDMKNFYLPGFLILLNTFASDVIFTVSLPLVIFWRKQSSRHETAEESNRSPTGELVYHENPTTLRSDLYRVCALYQLCKGLKLLGTMSAAAVHRRHLMVWKIFAPRFIFEGVSFIMASVILNLLFAFVLRVDNALNAWCLTLQNRLSHFE